MTNFDKNIFKVDNTNSKYYVDDIWFSGFLTKNNTMIYMINGQDALRHLNDQIDSLTDNQIYKRNKSNCECIQYFINTYGIWQNN